MICCRRILIIKTLLNEKGKELSRLGKYDEAITYFDTILNTDPNFVDSFWQS